jgi:serine/threonine protein kinase
MIGQTISHYRIIAKLGEGGMGVVYKAEDTRLDRTVALKFLGAHLITDEDGRRRFIREAKAAASLDHPNICTVYEIDEADGRIFLAMPCIEGRSLTEVIAAGPLKLPEALDIARQAARGLQEAHSKGIVHRDIKPPNIMIGTTGSGERLVKIMDFGLAQLSGVSKLTRTDTTLGTISYMSPEQTQGTQVDHRSDVWSLGAVLYEMVTGQQAFKGHYEQAVMYSILNEEPAPVTSVRAGVPMELEWILGKALAKIPERRYQSAVEFAVDLETLFAKLQPDGSTAARSTLRPGVPAPPPRLESAVAASGASAETSVEIRLQQRRRRARDLLLELGGQSLLPDRVLSQALDLLGKRPEQMQPADKRRGELLEELLQSRRVGEFIENWQQVEAAPAPSVAMPAEPEVIPAEESAMLPEEPEPVETGPSREWRTRAEIFGLPLIHCVRGVDPRTGNRRVAKGIVALGDIAMGLVACGGVAIGGVALGGVSVGFLAAGGCALGLMMSAGAVALGPEAFGAVTFSLAGDGLFSFALRAAFAFLVLRLLIRRRRFRKRFGSDGGAVGVWSMLGGRVWRSDGTPFRGGNVVATLGGCDVDLTGTTLDGSEVVIEATALFGGVKIIVPYGWRIVTHGSQLFGAYVNKTRPPQSAAAESAPRLLVKGFALFGGVEVTHAEPESSDPSRRRGRHPRHPRHGPESE